MQTSDRVIGEGSDAPLPTHEQWVGGQRTLRGHWRAACERNCDCGTDLDLDSSRPRPSSAPAARLHTAPPALPMDYGGGSVRVLILGDSGVGKTTIARLLTTAGPGSGTPAPTVGCTCGVVRHVYHDAEYFVELLDIGGASKYQAARSVFYHNKDGV